MGSVDQHHGAHEFDYFVERENELLIVLAWSVVAIASVATATASVITTG